MPTQDKSAVVSYHITFTFISPGNPGKHELAKQAFPARHSLPQRHRQGGQRADRGGGQDGVGHHDQGGRGQVRL